MQIKELSDIKFIKSSGNIEDFSPLKMTRYLKRLGFDDWEAEDLINSFKEECNEYLKTSEVIGMLERVAVRKISLIYPQWENLAAKLFFERILHERFNKEYPHLRNLCLNDKISKDWLNHFDKEQIDELNAYIKPERDALFNYKAANIFLGKYCHDGEMPQIAYMRVAIFLTMHTGDVEETKKLYDMLSTHQFTLATPIMVNALTLRPQTSSCALLAVDDSTRSLLDANTKIGTLSANLAGVSCNIQAIRSRGDAIRHGKTSGPVPFLKMFEATISAWNQGGTRPGALAIYFPWWTSDVFDLLSLKSNGGIDENRARRLKYALKINDYLIRAVMADEEVVLLSPHKAKDLHGVYGEEFDKRYEAYLKDPKNTHRVKAREIWMKLFKERVETGNIYIFHEENVNKVSMLNKYIGSSNLCTEVVLPTQPSSDFHTTINGKRHWEIYES